MKWARGGPLAALLLAGVAGCDDEDPVSPYIPLSEAEAELVGIGLWKQAHDVSVEIPLGLGSSPLVAPAQVGIDQFESGRPPCELGGSVTYDLAVVGTGDDTTGATDLTITTVQTHEDCTMEEGGLVFTLRGRPAVTTTVFFLGDGAGNFETSGAVVGEVEAQVGDVLGACPMDVAFEGAETALGAGAFSLSGEVCGVPVAAAVSYGGA